MTFIALPSSAVGYGSVWPMADLMIKETRPVTETVMENEQAEPVAQAPSSAVSDERHVAMLVDTLIV
ncbi:hypothetical protein [Streptomyces sp. NRRL S-813]|uniref:hypothetical protein n=1 Tax=Streptomyces sp. NRRL S-813 TaxID=1463919 RepID=UPI00131DC7DB|nr:hypothetical protein [Streptomyces sp. NRRL S-813]